MQAVMWLVQTDMAFMIGQAAIVAIGSAIELSHRWILVPVKSHCEGTDA